MTSTSKPTPGPWRNNGCLIEGSKMGLQIAQVQYRYAGDNIGFACQSKGEAFATARLIAEAGTVYHETGCSPRKLATMCAKERSHRFDVEDQRNEWKALAIGIAAHLENLEAHISVKTGKRGADHDREGQELREAGRKLIALVRSVIEKGKRS